MKEIIVSVDDAEFEKFIDSLSLFPCVKVVKVIDSDELSCDRDISNNDHKESDTL